MPFPGSRPAAAPSTPVTAPAAPLAPAPAAPAAPAAPGAPPAPATPVAERKFWVAINGASVLKTETEARGFPPTTQGMSQDQTSGWKTLAELLGGAPAVAPGGQRSAFGGRVTQTAPAAAATGAPAGIFAGIEGASVTRRGNNFEEGNYVCRLASAEYKQGREKNFVICEMEILISSFDPADPSTSGCNREGTFATVFVQKNDSFLPNMKEIVIACSGFDENGVPRDVNSIVTAEECNQFVSAEQPFAGALVYLEARLIKTRAGKDYTRVSWWPMPKDASGAPDFEKLKAIR